MDTVSILHSGDMTSRLEYASIPAAAPCFRSTVTVLMCDIVSSTHLTTTLPVETFRNLLLDYYRVCDDIVLRHNGLTLQYIGDGILSVFGEPFVGAGTALDAVRAGLSICQQEFCHLNHSYKIRVTASTGEIATGARIGSEPALNDAIFGTAPYLVSRLQSVTPPGSFIVDQNTFEKIEEYFGTQWMGLQELRGFQKLQPAWKVQSGKIPSSYQRQNASLSA